MKLPASVLGAIVLAACASSPVPPGAQVSAERLQQTVVPGATTKAQLLAAFGPTRAVVFDSGFETWVYQSPAGGGRFTEYVVLINPQGVVTRTRTGASTQP